MLVLGSLALDILVWDTLDVAILACLFILMVSILEHLTDNGAEDAQIKSNTGQEVSMIKEAARDDNNRRQIHRSHYR